MKNTKHWEDTAETVEHTDTNKRSKPLPKNVEGEMEETEGIDTLARI